MQMVSKNTNEQNVCECDKCVNALIGLSIYRDDCVGSLCFVVITVCALQLRLIFQFDFFFICFFFFFSPKKKKKKKKKE